MELSVGDKIESTTCSNNSLFDAIYKAWSDEEKPLVIFKGKGFSFTELMESVRDLEKHIQLINHGKKRREIITADIPNSVFMLVLMTYAAKNGEFLCPLNPDLRDEQIEKQKQTLEPTIHISNKLDEEENAKYYCKLDKKIYNISNIKAENEFEKAMRGKINLLEQDYLLTGSSGSTGKPKLIKFSQKTKLMRAQSAAKQWNLSKDDVILNASPIHHSLGQRLSILPMILGATQILLDKFSTELWLKSVDEHNVTFTIAVSTHLARLIEKNRFFELIRTKKLKTLVSSSSGLSIEVKQQLINQTGADIYEMYGASEIGTATVLNCKENAIKSKSVGRIIEDVSIRILDLETKERLGENSVGEIFVKSDLVFSGYYKNKSLTQGSFIDKYFGTGDIGYMDKDGFLYFKGRANECMKVGGVNVYCSDIVECISELNMGIEYRVISVNDKYMGQRPIVVIEEKNETPGVEELLEKARKIRAHCARNLAGYQMPSKVVFIEEFPYLSNGKPDLITLKDKVEKGVAGDRLFV